jgi:hypothetical protein
MSVHLEQHRYRQRDLERQARNERLARELREAQRRETGETRRRMHLLARLAALFA